MSYEKNIWQNGDIITKEKLNNMEDGISQTNMGGKIEVTITRGEGKTKYTLNKTYNEIVNLINNGIVPFVLHQSNDNTNITCITWVDRYPFLTIYTTDDDKTYSVDDPDGYPYYQQDDIV